MLQSTTSQPFICQPSSLKLQVNNGKEKHKIMTLVLDFYIVMSFETFSYVQLHFLVHPTKRKNYTNLKM